MTRIVQGDWCLTGALFRGEVAQLATKAAKWREKVFCWQFANFLSCIFIKELLIVFRKVDNSSFFAALLRNLGQLSSQTGYKVTMSVTCN